jgi:hypothetical protein
MNHPDARPINLDQPVANTWDGHERRQNELRMTALETGHVQLTRQLAEITTSLRSINGRFAHGTDRMDGMQKTMGEMQKELTANTSVTTDVRDLLDAGRSGLKVLGWLGAAAKWIGGMAAAALAVWGLWTAIKSGGPKP